MAMRYLLYAYACEVLSLGLLYFEFRDAIKKEMVNV